MQNYRKAQGGAAKQIAIGETNEANVLLGLGKFGWLTQSQLAMFCSVSTATMRHIVRRMIADKLIWSEAYQGSPAVKCYALTRKGTQKLRDDDRSETLDKISSFYKSKGFLSKFNHQYHRHLANEFILALQSDRIQVGSHILELVKSEHEMQSKKGISSTIFQCVPDALALTDEMTLIVIEIENSSRGMSQHGGSMSHWLSVLADKYQRDGYYADSLRTLFRELVIADSAGNTIYPDFDNVEQIFVCRTEGIFRNIWRKVERATTDFPDVRENISYVVLPDKLRWHNIFDGIEPLFHEEPETIERVKQGSDRYKYDLNKRIQIIDELSQYGFSRKDVAQQHGISLSTLDRWRRALEKAN